MNAECSFVQSYIIDYYDLCQLTDFNNRLMDYRPISTEDRRIIALGIERMIAEARKRRVYEPLRD